MESSKRSTKYRQLREAIRKGNTNLTRQLLSSNSQILSNRQSSSNTLLHSAVIKFQDSETIKMLVDKKVDLSVKNHRRQVPIHLAVHLNKTDVAEVLLKEGSYPKEYYKLLVFKATTNGNERLVKILVETGLKQYLSINYKNSFDFAVKRGYNDIVKYLIRHCKFNKQSDKLIPDDIVWKNDQQFKDCVEILFEHGFTISLRCLKDDNFIIPAVENGFTNIVEELLKMGLDPNLQEEETGLPLLHIACLCKQHRVTEILIKFGAKVNDKIMRWPTNPTYEEMIRFGKTPLDWAVRNLDIELTKLLLTNGASVDDSRVFIDVLREKQENWPKMKEIIEILVEYIADGNSTLCNGMNYVQYFAEYGPGLHISDYSTLNKIMTILTRKGADLNVRDPLGCKCTPLFIAIKANNFEMVKVLLEHGADVRKINNYGDTPLHSAATIKDPRYINLLLEYHADVNAATQIGLTPLHIAAYRGHPEIVKILLKCKANIEVKNSFGFTPLHSAVQSENSNFVVSVVQILLEHNAQVNVINSNGFSPLHIAVQNRYAQVVKILIHNNANVHSADNSGSIPLHLAIQYRCPKIVKLLLNNNVDVNLANHHGNTALHIAAMMKDVKNCRILLEHGANVFARNVDGQTALHFSAETNDIKTSQLLLNYKAEINARDSIGQTPFHYAGMVQSIEIIKFLLENKGDAVARDNEDRTPLFFISSGKQKWIPSIIKLLLQFNVEVDYYQEDKSGNSPFQIAQDQVKNTYTVDAFLEIDRLKTTNVGESNISFYGILKKSIFNLSRYAYNEKLIDTLKSEIYDKMFPLTIDLVRSRFTEGLARSKLLETFHDYSHLSNLNEVPYECIDNIVNYLSNEDLKHFITIVNPSRTSRN